MNIHRLGPDPASQPRDKAVSRELKKSIWLFLCNQDWFLIPFSNAHSISPEYCTTPLPINSNAISGVGETSFQPLESRPMEEPTLMSYQLMMHKGKPDDCGLPVATCVDVSSIAAAIFRAFFDDTACLSSHEGQDAVLRKLYDRVLQADSEIEAITMSLPRYLRLNGGHSDTSNKLPCFVSRQRYHFAMSIAHKVIENNLMYTIILYLGHFINFNTTETCHP